MGVHSAYKKIDLQYPLKSASLLSRLQRTLSCLAYYCPLFSEVPYLPEMVFPFVKLFSRGEEHLLFEVIVSILIQFYQNNFEYFPNPPASVLQLHDQILRQFDETLYSHLRERLGYRASLHVWPALRCLFTDTFTREQWLTILDHLVAYADIPYLFLLVNVAYMTHFKSSIMRMTSPQEFELFFSRSNPVDGAKLMKSVLSMAK